MSHYLDWLSSAVLGLMANALRIERLQANHSHQFGFDELELGGRVAIQLARENGNDFNKATWRYLWHLRFA